MNCKDFYNKIGVDISSLSKWQRNTIASLYLENMTFTKEELESFMEPELFPKEEVIEKNITNGKNFIDKLEKGREAEIGEIREWKGQKVQKTSQGWIPVKDGKPSDKGKDSNPKDADKQEKQKEYSEKELKEFAKKTSEEDLERASKGSDEKLRVTAKQELIRREEEESPKKGNDISNDKQRQLDIILSSNPMKDDIHTGIRNINDIKTAEEVFSEDEFSGTPDFTKKDAERALKSGKIKIYSSYPIKNGVFVSPSQMEAKNYAGGGKVYSKEIGLNEVAWVDSIEGQVALLES